MHLLKKKRLNRVSKCCINFLTRLARFELLHKYLGEAYCQEHYDTSVPFFFIASHFAGRLNIKETPNLDTPRLTSLSGVWKSYERKGRSRVFVISLRERNII